MKKITFLQFTAFFISASLLPHFLCAQELKPNQYRGDLIKHAFYTLSYLEDDKQPEWTFHMICSLCFGEAVRRNDFREDPSLLTESPHLSDYKNSGFDRGHLVPAGDMTRSDIAMSESFYLSNISPQTPEFNRGIWKKLEQQIRDWSDVYDTLYIVTGPIIEPGHGTIGPGKVSVPQYFFKAVYIPKASKMIGYIIPNTGSKSTLKSFQVTIDEIELRTKLDLFYALDDRVEIKLERALSSLD